MKNKHSLNEFEKFLTNNIKNKNHQNYYLLSS